jgi:transglutaminase-like putative cysteine protease
MGARGAYLTMLALCATAGAVGMQPAAAGDAPAWMHAQITAPVPAHDEKTDAVMLYSETILTVQPNGKVRRLYRQAVKILRPDGEAWGTARVYFDPQSRIVDLHAWCIPAFGKDYEIREKEAVESAVLDVEGGLLVSDTRTKSLRIPAAIPGSIVGYEVEQEFRPYMMVDEWGFQDTIPVREALYTLKLPPGWTYKTNWLNHPDESPMQAAPGEWRWSVSDLKGIRVEKYMPPWQGIAGHMVIAFAPPTGQDAGIQSWRDLGAWYLTLTRERRNASPEIRQKVAELTASVPTLLGKMQALAAFVQSDVRYVAIELGIGGHQPHAAAEVFNHHYGDCKDKANLLITMLKEIGVDSYAVVINTVRGSVTATTPPDLSFNHAIVAIALPPDLEATNLKATLVQPKLGRLLFFDPTDDLTPLGLLSGGLQANYGMLVTPEGGDLVRLPQLALDTNGTARTGKMTLDEKGTLRGDVHEVRSGDSAAYQRGTLRSVTVDTDRIKPVEAIAAASLSTFQIVKASIANLRAPDRPFEWNYSLEAENYAKTSGDLLLVRPRVLGVLARGFLETKEPRQFPVEFEGPERDTDYFEITFPAGFEVEELPPAIDVDDGFAAYHSKTEAAGRTLRYSRTIEFKDLSVPADKAPQLKDFYRTIAGDERNSAVLKRVAQ